VFKSVEYIGFEKGSELEAKAKQANEVLGTVIRSWRDDLLVTWRPAAMQSDALVELTLSLTLPNAAASASGRIRSRDFNPGEEGYLRMNLRDVWLDLLDRLIAQMESKREEWLAEPVEA
jgi:hypothetical protein